jgi:hypothetical protein
MQGNIHVIMISSLLLFKEDITSARPGLHSHSTSPDTLASMDVH